jgi:hypothetical protein
MAGARQLRDRNPDRRRKLHLRAIQRALAADTLAARPWQPADRERLSEGFTGFVNGCLERCGACAHVSGPRGSAS